MTAPGVYTPSQGSRDEELVEVVARALWDRTYEFCDEPPNPSRDLLEECGYVGDATAAINAIREWEGR